MSGFEVLPFTEFVRDVLGVTLEPAQRVFWGVAGGEFQPRELSGQDREIAGEAFGDVDEVPPAVLSVVAALKGADVGFSFVGALRLLWRAYTAALTDAAPGEVRPALLVAPDLRLGRGPVEIAKEHAERVPALRRLLVPKNKGRDGFVVKRDGGRFSGVECLPATGGGRATRGRRYVEVVFDEAAFFRDKDFAVNDADVYRSIAPRCLGQIWLGSTPWLETALIHQFFEKNFGAPKDALAARLPTLLVRTNKRTRSMVERERARDPENAAREFDCVALPGNSAAFFDPASIERAFVDSLLPFTAQDAA